MFSKDMIQNALDRAPKRVFLPGFMPNRDLQIGGRKVTECLFYDINNSNA